MKITTWNVNGIRARAAQVEEWIAREAPDVLCLQELKASPEQVPAPLGDHPGYWCYWHGFKGYSGVALNLSRRTFPARPAFFHPDFDHEGRIVAARAGDLVFASIYVPNGGKDFPAKLRFLEALRELAAREREAGRRVVLCGDLNVALEPRDVHPRLRKETEIGQTPHERELLAAIIGQGLVDLGRRFEPGNDELFTWWAPWRQLKERNIGWRLDYVLASEPVARAAKGCGVRREFGTSDHAPVTAELELAVPDVPAAPPAAGKGQMPLF